MFGTKVVCTDCDPFNNKDGFGGSWVMGCIIILNLFSLLSTFCFQIPHGCCDISESLFEATPTGMLFKVFGVLKVLAEA